MSAETREEYIGDEIQKLIAPPVSNEGKSQKRGWRRRNNEYCEACKDGGELVCCEKCPVSYHPTCTNPPCDANDLPDKWICRGCTLKASQSYEEEDEESQQKGLFDMLLAHKKPMNPSNFVIPPSVTQESNLPGERRQRKKAGKNKRPYHEIDSNGCVQLSRLTGEPIKLCHHCNISSRKAQLIMCDFCPLFFHADCLNPPLKYPPTTKWMCPVHPERMLLQNRDLFVSQRKAIADLFSTEHVDPNFIITELLRKRQRSTNLRPSTSKLLNDSSIELANAGSLPKRKSIVPIGIKKAYKTRRYIDECTASEADAELVLSCIPSFGKEKLSEKQKRLSLIPDEEPKTPEEVDVPENFSCLLMPLEVDAPPIFVCEPISNIGTSPENDIVLQAEKCEAISPHHAVLYQDLSGSFELLNYSIHGMIVNGIEYGLEDPEIAVHKPDDPITSDFTDRIHEMSKFGGWKITEDKKKVEWLKDKVIVSDESEDESNAAKNASESEVACQSLAKLKKSPCPSPTPSVGSEKSKAKKRAKKSAKQSPEVPRHKCGCSVPEPGWESPVQLSHGSVIQFGCNKYLFVSKDAYIEEPPAKEAKDQVKKEEVS